MRLTTFLCLLVLAAGCTGPKNTAVKTNPLNGSWVPVREEMGGQALPKAAFEKQKLVISDSNYTFTAESVDKGVVVVKDNKMDIYGREGVNKGKHFPAIYKMENGQITICYNLSGERYPEAFDTKGKPLFFLCVFARETGN